MSAIQSHSSLLLAGLSVVGLAMSCQSTAEPNDTAEVPTPESAKVESPRLDADRTPTLADLVAGLSDRPEPGSLPETYPTSRSRTGTSTPRPQSLGTRLSRTRVPSLKVEGEESLRNLVDRVRAMTGLPLVVTQGAEDAVSDAGIVYDLQLDHPIRTRSLLDLIVELSDDEIGWTVRHGAVIITTATDARGKLVTHLHDIRAAIRPRTDFHAPRVAHLGLGVENGSDDDPFGGAAQAAPRFDRDRLVDLIQSSIAPGTWEDEGVSIDITDSGLLLVRHSREVQLQVASFVARLGV